ncbi:hypothetical protein TWF706_010773, partial [Orbilia oligospora]
NLKLAAEFTDDVNFESCRPSRIRKVYRVKRTETPDLNHLGILGDQKDGLGHASKSFHSITRIQTDAKIRLLSSQAPPQNNGNEYFPWNFTMPKGGMAEFYLSWFVDHL